MLKKIMLLAALATIWFLPMQSSFAVEHPPAHGGGNSSGGAGSAGCPKVGIRNMNPAALSEVAAGSAFSFIVFGAKDPSDIEVTAKQLPVATKVEVKDNFFLVSGQLPTELKATAARINVKVKGKIANCTEENGWLLKITH